MTPYLKGINKSLELWIKGRDKDGWGLSHKEIITFSNANGLNDTIHLEKNANISVTPGKMMKSDDFT